MTQLASFPPTLEAARSRIADVRPADYARSRNALDGAVTGLSPYLTHGFVDLAEVLAGVASRHPLDVGHKFVYELGWREYFRHVWQHRGAGILQSLHQGLLPESVYSPELPHDIREARTGVPVIDRSVRTLYATGYLHNHARMWVASYVVHLRKVHWRAGADWMVAHLLDGDLASNHLSWQWVAGTGSSKAYLFDAGNVARYAPSAWHSPGSVIDTSYEALDAIARSTRPIPATPSGDGVEEPPVWSAPPGDLATPTATFGAVDDPEVHAHVRGREVWLVHPWALGEPPADLPVGCLCLGWWPAEHHTDWPWSASRWRFVAARMQALSPIALHARTQDLSIALRDARSVRTLADPHVSHLLPPEIVQRAPRRLFADVPRPCASFSSWWHRSVRGVQRVADLPGLVHWREYGAADRSPTRPVP